MKGKTFKRSGCEFEFMPKVNGRKLAAILDTGSPISIMPKSYAKVVRPMSHSSRIIEEIRNVNGRPFHITNRYKLNTEMNGIEKPNIWWQVETKIKPIIGMGNFVNLGLQLIQRPTNDNLEKASGKTGLALGKDSKDVSMARKRSKISRV